MPTSLVKGKIELSQRYSREDDEETLVCGCYYRSPGDYSKRMTGKQARLVGGGGSITLPKNKWHRPDGHE